MRDKEKIIEIETFEIEDKSKPKQVKTSEISRRPLLRKKNYCEECKKREAKVDFDKNKDIDQLKIFLKNKSNYIRDLHYKKGFSLKAIFLEIQEKYNKCVCYGSWRAHKGIKHLYDFMKPELRDLALYKILKYSNWDVYNKSLSKLNTRARYNHGFTNN